MRRRRGNGLTQHTHSLGREKVHGTVAPLSLNNKELCGHFRAVPDRRIRLSQETATRRWLSVCCNVISKMMIIIVLQKRNRSVPLAECAPMLQNMPSQVDGWTMMHNTNHTPVQKNHPGDGLRNARVKPIIQNNRGGHKLLISRYYFDQKVRIKKYLNP